MTLPLSIEEYTVFSIENQHIGSIITSSPENYKLEYILCWIVYTIKNFPDLVELTPVDDKTRDGAPITIQVTIAKVLIGDIYNWENSFQECVDLLVERNQITMREYND